MKRTPKDLLGKKIIFVIPCTAEGVRRKWGGTRTGMVVKVDSGPRIGFRGVRVRFARWDGRDADGTDRWAYDKSCKSVYVNRREIEYENTTSGVIWYGKVRPLREWLGCDAA